MKILIKGISAITAADELILSNANIGITDDRISFVQAADQPIPRDFCADKVIDGTRRLAIPGLVNAHCHAAMTLLRGYADDLDLETWLFKHIFPAEAQLTEADVRVGTTLGIAEMLRSGTTCFHDMYLKMDSVAQAVAETGIRAAVSIGPLLTGKRETASVNIESCREFFKRWNGAADGRIRTNMEIHSLYLYQPETLKAGAELAREMQTEIHIHILETLTERRNMLKEFGKSTVCLAEEYGLLDNPVIAAHCIHVDDDDISRLKRKHVNVVHNPSSNLKLASGIAPIPKMLSQGINVCLGTDGAASNNQLNMFEEIRLAALLHKGADRDPMAVSAAEAFMMATENGATALGWRECGRIKAGMKADLAVLNIDKPHLTPMYNPIAGLVYSAQASDVETVLVNGKILMEHRELLTIDEEKVRFEANQCTEKYR